MTTPKDFSIDGFDHIEFYVPDQARAAAWYGERFGFAPIPELTGWTDGGPLMIAVDDGRSKLALFAGQPPLTASPVGYRRLAFRVDGPRFLEFVSRVADLPVCDGAGNEVRTLPLVDHEHAFSVYFCDPWGHPLEVTTYDVAHVHEHRAR